MGDRLPLRGLRWARRWPRGLAGRVLVATAVVTAVTSAVVLVQTVTFTTQALLQRLSDADSDDKLANIAACRRFPERFRAQGPSGAVIFAYDIRTARSLNPDAPPIDPSLLERVAEGVVPASRIYWTGSEWGGVTLDAVSGEGPCSLFQILWPRADRARRRGYLSYLGGIGGVLASGLLLAFVFAVRPSVRRLSDLERRSRALGLAEGFDAEPEPYDDSIGRLSTALARAHERLVRAAEAEREQQDSLRRHLAQVAHDLRTPLSSSQLAIEEQLAATPPEHAAPLVKVLDDLVYMDGLTNNLHLASRMERVTELLDRGGEVDLGQVVDFVVDRFRILGRRHGIEVSGGRPDAPVIVRCDPPMAQQLVANLVHNAVVHGARDGHVAVLLELSGDDFELKVMDDGPGLSAEQLERLAEPPQASPAVTGGGGLGLRIARAVALHAEWTLDFANTEPCGLCITVRGRI